jgi:hypothetical protein
MISQWYGPVGPSARRQPHRIENSCAAGRRLNVKLPTRVHAGSGRHGVARVDVRVDVLVRALATRQLVEALSDGATQAGGEGEGPERTACVHGGERLTD